MADAQLDNMEARSQPRLFFAGSDDEDEVVKPPEPQRLFFADSEDEDAMQIPNASFTVPQKREQESDSDIEIPSVDHPRASSVSSGSSDHGMLPSSPLAAPEELPDDSRDLPPAKKRRLSPKLPRDTMASGSAYLGSFLVGNAWSTVRGKGYIKPGEEFLVERDDQGDALSKASSSTQSKNQSKKTAQGKGKQKQLSIAVMLKQKQAKPSKKKADTVVRLTNRRGFGQTCLLWLQMKADPRCRIWPLTLGGGRLDLKAPRHAFVFLSTELHQPEILSRYH